jgi:hypothetical protein
MLMHLWKHGAMLMHLWKVSHAPALAAWAVTECGGKMDLAFDAARLLPMLLMHELHPLEEELHVLGSGMTQRDYAEMVGKKPTPVAMRMQAAKVAQACSDIGATALKERWSQLAEIHAAPSWLWPALAAELVAAREGNAREMK